MRTLLAPFSKSRHLIIMASFTMIVIFLFACTPDGASDGAEANKTPAGGGAGGGGTAVPTRVPTIEEEDDSDGGLDEDPSEPLMCPAEATTYMLVARHHFWTETGLGKWQWEAVGSVRLQVEGEELVGGQATDTFEGLQYGTFSDGENSCSFEAPAEIHTTVFGSCRAGLLTLEITEDWRMGTYEWVCDEDNISFDLPPMGGPSNHPNIVFSLAELGLDKFEVPWGGGGGTKAWSLLNEMDPIPIAP